MPGLRTRELWRIEAQYRREEEALERGGAEADPLALSALADQIGEAEDALSACISQHPVVPVQMEVMLVDGVIASASIPTAFPPVRLGSEHYVDGGIRDMVPIEPAVRLGATRVYAVCSSASKMPLWRSAADGHVITSYDSTNLLDITGRVSMDIMTNEITRSKTDPPNGWGATEVIVIEPEFDLHDIMTIDPGLIRIAMSHGYMRADDVTQAYQENQIGYRTRADEFSRDRNTTTITRLRRMIWEKEYAANGWAFAVDGFGRPKPASQLGHIAQADADTALEDVRRMKRDLKALVDQRLAAVGLCPDNVDLGGCSGRSTTGHRGGRCGMLAIRSRRCAICRWLPTRRQFLWVSRCRLW